jgi:hypothetical protein
MAAPNKEELEALGKFRTAILDSDLKLTTKQCSDMSLIPWLRERDLNIPKALDMIKKHYEWRKQEDIDNILLWKPPRNYDELFPYSICGRSKDRNPLLIMGFGKWDFRDAIEKGEKKEWVRYVDQMVAKAHENMDESNATLEPGMTPVTQCILICDFKDFSLRQVTSVGTVQALIEVTKLFVANYPDLMAKVYYINTPRAFSVFFSILKPFYPPRLLGLIEIYTNDNHWKCKQSLLKRVSPDQLPVALGGIQTNSCKFLVVGDGSDKTLQRHVTDDGIEMITIDISAGQEYRLDLEIGKENTTLEYSFKTDHYDIGFSIMYNFSDEILPFRKCDSHLAPEEGSIECEEIGTYTLVFDNKYSQFRGKTLHFSVGVFEPEDTRL